MNRKRKVILVGLLVVVAIVITGPNAWRAGSLYWAKHRARGIFDKYTPSERRILDETPATVLLPPSNLDGDLRESAQLEGYRFEFPKPVSRLDKANSVVLNYPRYQVIIRSPIELASSDAAAKRLHFIDTFDEYSAAYHLKMEDLDAQPDLESFRRYLLLFAQKGGSTFCREQFTSGGLRGFVWDPAPGEKLTVTMLFFPDHLSGCGVWFIDQNGLTHDEIDRFLAALRIDAIKRTSTHLSTTKAGNAN